MARPRRDRPAQPPDTLEITLEDLEGLDEAVTQGEINLVAHYFRDLLEELGKGSAE